jgi:hypothetical protein
MAHNIVNTGTIWGITNQVSPSAGAPSGNYFTVGPELTGRIKKVNTILAVNSSTTTDYEASVYVYIPINSGVGVSSAAWLAKDVVVPAKSSMVIVSGENPVYVEEDGYIAGYSNVASTLQFTISYEVIF